MNFIVKKFNELNTQELYEILKARASIFIIEQNINYQDMDNIDYDALHIFYMNDNKVIAYMRAFYTDKEKKIVKIGRVLTIDHGKGLGRKLLENSLEEIKTKMSAKKIVMNAQKQAVGFYEKFGFHVVSDEFLEAGVVHVKMEKTLENLDN